MNDLRIILVSLVTGTAVRRSLWSDWAMDNGECLSLLELTMIANDLRTTGEYRLNDHLIVNAEFVAAPSPSTPAVAA
jgi:hypothetical protein